MNTLIQTTLQNTFGFTQLREGQQAVITHIVNNQSAMAIFPTGAGKSLCYQLPALLLPHLTLVVSPLLSLMQDQVNFLKKQGVPAETLDSTKSHDESVRVMTDIRAGNLKILFISVERLKNERFREFIKTIPISLLVVDEAHCISEWSYNFRPDYLKLPDYQKEFNIPNVLLLTATATPKVVDYMQNKFAIPNQNIIKTGFYRPNLNLMVKGISNNKKLPYLINILIQKQQQPTIIYVTLQKTAETVAKHLSNNGIQAFAYHAGMNDIARKDTQLKFMAGEINCIVATIAFGMGIDKSNIRQIIHYDLPKSIENYSQEIGRAGRDGETSNCLVLVNKDNINVLENFVYGDTPEYAEIYSALQIIKELAYKDNDIELKTFTFCSQTNIKNLVLKTLLVQLELLNIIKPKYTYYQDYRFKLKITAAELVAKFNDERKQFTQTILHCSSLANKWNTVDFDQLQREYPKQRKRVVSALDYFDQKGWIELETSQATEVYELLQPDFSITELTQQLYDYFYSKEKSEIARIYSMFDFFIENQCLSSRLATYFGDTHAPTKCGHCSICREKLVSLPDPIALPELSINQLQELTLPFITKYQEIFNTIPSNITLTRFLCGLPVPFFTKIKAKNLKEFGILEQYFYKDILEILNYG